MKRRVILSFLIVTIFTSQLFGVGITEARAATSTILGTTGNFPYGITLDSSGNIYTTNYAEHTVSKITPAGVSTILGTTGNNPYGITIDSLGNIYTSNTGANNVSKIAILDAPAFTLSSSTESRTVNTAATGFTINSTGGAIASFSINATPPGMSFNTTTGALTGTPITVASATTYTITATNASGSATQTFALTVTVASVASDNSAANAEAARVAAAQAEAARKAKEQKELTEILALIPSLGSIALNLGETTKTLTLQKCVKKTQVKYVKKGANCPKGFVKKK